MLTQWELPPPLRAHLPRRGRPIRVVVALLGALEARTGAVGILARARGPIRVQVLVGRVQTLVALAVRARVVKGGGLVQTCIRVRGVWVGRVAVGAVTHRALVGIVGAPRLLAVRAARAWVVHTVVAHVLDDDLAFGLLAPARVLCGPRNGEYAAGVVLDDLGGTHARIVRVRVAAVAVSTLGIVLRVHQTVVVVAVAASLGEAVVRAGRVLHVDVRHSIARGEKEQRQHACALHFFLKEPLHTAANA